MLECNKRPTEELRQSEIVTLDGKTRPIEELRHSATEDRRNERLLPATTLKAHFTVQGPFNTTYKYSKARKLQRPTTAYCSCTKQHLQGWRYFDIHATVVIDNRV